MKSPALRLPALVSACCALFAAASNSARSSSWDWDACHPAGLRGARTPDDLANPFALSSREDRLSSPSSGNALPENACAALERLAGSLRGCLRAPAEVLLIGERLFRPGEQLPASAEGARESGLRILLQRIDERGAHLAVWCSAAGARPVQRDVVLRPGETPGSRANVEVLP